MQEGLAGMIGAINARFGCLRKIRYAIRPSSPGRHKPQRTCTSAPYQHQDRLAMDKGPSFHPTLRSQLHSKDVARLLRPRPGADGGVGRQKALMAVPRSHGSELTIGRGFEPMSRPASRCVSVVVGDRRRLARRFAARGRSLLDPVRQPRVLGVLQLEPDGRGGHIGDLASGRRDAGSQLGV